MKLPLKVPFSKYPAYREVAIAAAKAHNLPHNDRYAVVPYNVAMKIRGGQAVNVKPATPKVYTTEQKERAIERANICMACEHVQRRPDGEPAVRLKLKDYDV